MKVAQFFKSDPNFNCDYLIGVSISDNEKQLLLENQKVFIGNDNFNMPIDNWNVENVDNIISILIEGKE